MPEKSGTEPPPPYLDYIAPLNCRKCDRLASFIDSYRHSHPEWHNNPVPSFGPRDAVALILGLAPGLKGANASGRPFTGDFAGQVLFNALLACGLAEGRYQASKNDGLALKNIRISNAVRCVPPQNKPTAAEISACRPYLSHELSNMENLRLILCLGRISHETCLRHFKLKLSSYPFVHNRLYTLPSDIKLLSSYHCSRYNIQTKRLSFEMFQEICTRLKIEAGLDKEL